MQFKAEFTYKNGSKLQFQVGDEIPSQADTLLNLSNVREEMRSALVETFAGMRRSPTPGPSIPSSSVSYFWCSRVVTWNKHFTSLYFPQVFSPSTHLPERLDINKCRICKKKEVTEGLIEYSSDWILCTLKDECNYRVSSYDIRFIFIHYKKSVN